MKSIQIKVSRRQRRKTGMRKRIRGAPDRPRLSVFRSGRHIYAQVIDDLAGRTIASASSHGLEQGGNRAAAAEVGKLIAERATGAGIGPVVFDRNGYRYHGRVKALADAAREGGLKF